MSGSPARPNEPVSGEFCRVAYKRKGTRQNPARSDNPSSLPQAFNETKISWKSTTPKRFYVARLFPRKRSRRDRCAIRIGTPLARQSGQKFL
jgi:hypothetical protein